MGSKKKMTKEISDVLRKARECIKHGKWSFVSKANSMDKNQEFIDQYYYMYAEGSRYMNENDRLEIIKRLKVADFKQRKEFDDPRYEGFTYFEFIMKTQPYYLVSQNEESFDEAGKSFPGKRGKDPDCILDVYIKFYFDNDCLVIISFHEA